MNTKNIALAILLIGISYGLLSCRSETKNQENQCQEPTSKAFERIRAKIDTTSSQKIIEAIKLELVEIRNCPLSEEDEIEHNSLRKKRDRKWKNNS